MSASDLAVRKALDLEKRRQDLTKILGDYGKSRGSGRWDPIRHPIDFAIISAVRTPGLLSVPALEEADKWEVITGPGLSGAFPVYRGAEIIEVDLVCRLYDKSDWDQFHVLRPVLERPKIGRRPKSLRILYPLFELVSPPLREIVKKKTKLEGPDDNGVWTWTISCLQYRRKKIDQAKPTSGPEVTPMDPYEVEAAMKTIQSNLLAGEIEQLQGGGG